ncbi:MAG: site-specific integrase [Phycisphaeraceae bacterium]
MATKWKRGTVNARQSYIVAAFKFGVAQELVPVTAWQALTSVPRLRRGEAGAIEGKKIGPVPLAHVEAVKPYLSPQIVALIDLQLLTGARGGELCIMRPCDLTTTGKVWEFRPQHHKGQHLDHERVIYLGPRAQAVVMPFLADRALDACLFDPREGNAQRKAAHASKGKPRRPDQKPNPTKSARKISDHYTAGSYRKAIERACITAGVPDWHPHQLRHTAATELRRQFGLEAASLMLGHASGAITDAVYAERDAGKAHAIALRVG